jgi:hypothetical protein
MNISKSAGDATKKMNLFAGVMCRGKFDGRPGLSARTLSAHVPCRAFFVKNAG